MSTVAPEASCHPAATLRVDIVAGALATLGILLELWALAEGVRLHLDGYTAAPGCVGLGVGCVPQVVLGHAALTHRLVLPAALLLLLALLLRGSRRGRLGLRRRATVAGAALAAAFLLVLSRVDDGRWLANPWVLEPLLVLLVATVLLVGALGNPRAGARFSVRSPRQSG